MCHGAHCVCLWFPALNLLTLQKNFADRLNGSQQQMQLLLSQSLWCMCQVKSLNSLFHFNNSLWEWVWPPGDHSTCPPIYLSLLWPQSTASSGWIFSFWLAGADRINPTLLLYSGLSLNSSLRKSTSSSTNTHRLCLAAFHHSHHHNKRSILKPRLYLPLSL